MKVPLKTLKESVVSPLIEFLKRSDGAVFFAFIFFFGFGDSFAGSMSRPFYAKIGFDNKNHRRNSLYGRSLFSSLLGLLSVEVLFFDLGITQLYGFQGFCKRFPLLYLPFLPLCQQRSSLLVLFFLRI